MSNVKLAVQSPCPEIGESGSRLAPAQLSPKPREWGSQNSQVYAVCSLGWSWLGSATTVLLRVGCRGSLS